MLNQSFGCSKNLSKSCLGYSILFFMFSWWAEYKICLLSYKFSNYLRQLILINIPSSAKQCSSSSKIWLVTSWKYNPFLDISSSWVPCSFITPLSIAQITSADFMVDKRWATTMVVLPFWAYHRRRKKNISIKYFKRSGSEIK